MGLAGTLGAAVTAATLLQGTSSVALLFPDRLQGVSSKLGGLRKLYRLHGVVAATVYALGVCTVLLGYVSGWSAKNLTGATWYAVAAATVAVAAIITAQVMKLGR